VLLGRAIELFGTFLHKTSGLLSNYIVTQFTSERFHENILSGLLSGLLSDFIENLFLGENSLDEDHFRAERLGGEVGAFYSPLVADGDTYVVNSALGQCGGVVVNSARYRAVGLWLTVPGHTQVSPGRSRWSLTTPETS